MKKIFLLLLIALWQLSCMAIELTEAEIMPKKLLFAELPENYPTEIDKLFDFYYHTCKELYSRIDNMTDSKANDSILENYISEFSDDKIRQFVYWEWLATNHIPLYFSEYLSLNEIDLRDKFWELLIPFFDEIEKLTYYPNGVLEMIKQNIFPVNLWLSSIRRALYGRYHNEINAKHSLPDFSSVKIYKIGTVLNIETVPVSKHPESNIASFELIKIDTGDKIEVITQTNFDGFSNDFFNLIQIGKKYMFGVFHSRLNYKLKNYDLTQGKIKLEYPNIIIPTTMEIVDNVIIINSATVGWQNFLNVDKKLTREQLQTGHARLWQQYYDTPLDVFIDRYHNFYKEILGE
jgi:hypothetical protein